MPLTPFLSLSSTKRDRYSGDLRFRLRKYSKSPAIICLNWRSPLNEWYRKWSEAVLQVQQVLDEAQGVPLAAILLCHQGLALLPQVAAHTLHHRLEALLDPVEQPEHAGQVLCLLVFQHVHHAGVNYQILPTNRSSCGW
uniref:Putative cullin 3 n=1 Tax=Ixodes ricinus TaxID=34613 RepID=A0A0K8RCG2_IXORI